MSVIQQKNIGILEGSLADQERILTDMRKAQKRQRGPFKLGEQPAGDGGQLTRRIEEMERTISTTKKRIERAKNPPAPVDPIEEHQQAIRAIEQRTDAGRKRNTALIKGHQRAIARLLNERAAQSA